MDKNEEYEIISEIQTEHQALWRDKRRWVIVEETNGQYAVHEHTIDSVAPMIMKPNKREAAARLLQIMGLGPVGPQDYPESICIGEITRESAEVFPLKERPHGD